MTTPWKPLIVKIDADTDWSDVDGPGLLKGLANGDVAVVVLRGLLADTEFTRNRDRIVPLFDRARTTSYSNGSLTTVGPYLAKHLADPPAYFREAAEADALTASVGFDLAARTRAALADVLGLTTFTPALEPDGRRYAQQNVRIYAGGLRTPLHNDNMMRDAAGTGLILAELRHHLSCVVCIQECDAGGELAIHRKTWQPDDERFKIVDGLGYDEAVVDGVASCRFKPQAGDVYLLNPTHYHSIERVTGADRVTMGFFFGFFDDALSDAVAWV
jgi:hypothetical protein